MGVYFFYGDEEYLIDKELEKYRAKLDKNFSEMNYSVYEKLDYADLISVLRTQPMMFGKMMMVALIWRFMIVWLIASLTG